MPSKPRRVVSYKNKVKEIPREIPPELFEPGIREILTRQKQEADKREELLETWEKSNGEDPASLLENAATLRLHEQNELESKADKKSRRLKEIAELEMELEKQRLKLDKLGKWKAQVFSVLSLALLKEQDEQRRLDEISRIRELDELKRATSYTP